MSSNPQLTSSTPRVTSINLLAMSTISQVRSSNRPIEMKTHGNSLTNYLGSELVSMVSLKRPAKYGLKLYLFQELFLN